MTRSALALVTGVVVGGLAGGLPRALDAQARNPFTAGMDLRAGQRTFASRCSPCHGLDARGSDNGADLTAGALRRASDDAGLFRVISDGVPQTQMVGIGTTADEQTIWQLVTYINSLRSRARVEVAGDPAVGERLFREKGDCARCHSVNGAGGRYGPDLTSIGSRRTPSELRSDLLAPDERLDPAWWALRLTRRDGSRLEGLRLGEDTYSVRLIDADGNLWSFLKADLAGAERLERSLMPSVEGRLSEDETEHLIAYLYGLIGGGR